MEKQIHNESIFSKIVFWLIFGALNIGTLSALGIFYKNAICLLDKQGPHLCEGAYEFFGLISAFVIIIPSLIMDYFLIKNRREFFKNKFIVFFLSFVLVLFLIIAYIILISKK